VLATALCLFGNRASAGWDVPALPICRPLHEWRTPVPVWTPGFSKDGTLHSAPPELTNSVIYVDVGLDSDAPACREPPRNGLFEFDVPKGAPGASNGVEVKLADDQMGQDSLRDCIFNGFYTIAAGATEPNGVHEIILRPHEKSEIITSGRYCRVSAGAPAGLPGRAPVGRFAPQHEIPGTRLPTCRADGEDRIEIPIWEAQRKADGQLRSSPPQRYGELVFMTIVSANNCHAADAQQALAFPDSGTDAFQGGISLSLTGNSSLRSGHCVWSGLFMYDSANYHMGWAFLAYSSVDEAKVASTGQFCLTRRHGPLHRPTPEK